MESGNVDENNITMATEALQKGYKSRDWLSTSWNSSVRRSYEEAEIFTYGQIFEQTHLFSPSGCKTIDLSKPNHYTCCC